MGKGRLFYRGVLGLLLFLVAPKVALPQSQLPSVQPTPRTSRTLDLKNIKISSAASYLIETHAPGSTVSPYPAILVHIQEAHTNYEAQQNIVQILEQLVKDYNLKLILVEGSAGDVSLAHLRRYSPSDHRKRVADTYLKAGLISGEEYLDLVSDYPLILWGVEDEGLYQENVEAFLGSEPLQQSIRPELNAVRESAEALRPSLLNAALNALDVRVAAFDRRELTLAEYARALRQTAQEHGVALERFPNLVEFLAVCDQEQALRRPETQAEQRLLLAALSTRVPQNAFDALMAQAPNRQSGGAGALSFYTTLEAAAKDAGVSMAAYPRLAAYVAYLRASASVSTAALDRELEACVAALRARLAETSESRQLCELLDALHLFGKLLDFDLSPDEYQRFAATAVESAWPHWERFLAEQLAQAGLPTQAVDGLRHLHERMAPLQRFYDVARRRDEVMVRNAVSKLEESGEPLAVLITGGFHSPRITAMLQEHGIPTIMLIPKVTHATNDRLYRAVVRYKSGHGGSFEEVMDLANRSTAKQTTAEAVRP